jgi:hypothetical protein
MTTALLAFSWGTFWFWVAVSVVAGLIVLLIGGIAGWAVRRRGQRNRWAFQEYLGRMPYHAGLSAVASEVRDAADIAQRCEEGQGHVPELVGRLSVQAWADRRGEMDYLRTDDPPTWDALEETYRALRQSKQGGGYPPKSADLLALAERLEKTLKREERPRRYDPTAPRRGWFG